MKIAKMKNSKHAGDDGKREEAREASLPLFLLPIVPRTLFGQKLQIYATSKGHHHRRPYVILYLSFGEQIRTESEQSRQSAPT